MAERLIFELICPTQGKADGYGARLYRRPESSAEKCSLVFELRSRVTEPEEFMKLISCCAALHPPGTSGTSAVPCLVHIPG